jgi:uncharacterized membrane protein
MSNLVVVGFDEPHKAEEVRLKLQKLQSEYLLDLADAVVAVKDEKGKVKLHQAGNLTADGAMSGGFCGSLTGLIFLNAATGVRKLSAVVTMNRSVPKNLRVRRLMANLEK